MRAAACLVLVLRCDAIALRRRRVKAPPAAPVVEMPELIVLEETETPLLNLEFVPRVGWKGTVFPAVLSPACGALAAAAATLYAHVAYG